MGERQIQERQQVFEISYKIGAMVVAAAAFALYTNKHNLPSIINDLTNFHVLPGNMFWPFWNVALLLFALPLIVAAYRKVRSL